MKKNPVVSPWADRVHLIDISFDKPTRIVLWVNNETRSFEIVSNVPKASLYHEDRDIEVRGAHLAINPSPRQLQIGSTEY